MRHYLNPKSLTLGQLYGEFDVNTREWHDGVLSSIVRSCSRGSLASNNLHLSMASPAHANSLMSPRGAAGGHGGFSEEDMLDATHWVILDGPVDPMWIENLNTVS